MPWETFTASYDRKFIPKFCEEAKPFFSGGVLLNYDHSSEISDLTFSNINLTGSYTTLLDAHHLLTLGVLVGVATRGFDHNSLTWDSQWDESTFNFNQSSISGEKFDSEKVSYLETGVGINYLWQKSSRTKVDAGVGIFHLVPPNVGYYDIANIKLERRYTFSAVGQFQLSENTDLQGFAMMEVQGPYRETVLGVLKKLYLDKMIK